MLRLASRILLRNNALNNLKISRSPSSSDPSSIKPQISDKYQQHMNKHRTIAKNKGIMDFLSKTYNTSAVAITGVLTSAYLGTNIQLLVSNPLLTSLIGAISAFGSFYIVNSINPKNITQIQFGVPIHRTQNQPSRILAYTAGITSLGLSTSPLFLYTQLLNPSLIPLGIGITCGIYCGASGIGYLMPPDKILGSRHIIMGSLLGLVSINVLGIASTLLVGDNTLALLLFNVNNYGGILLFSILIGYDTHIAIKQYQNGNADHLRMSIQLILNFWNIFIRLLSILNRKE